jgi:hypothetical protein
MKKEFKLVNYKDIKVGDIVKYTKGMVVSYSRKVIWITDKYILLEGIAEIINPLTMIWQRLENVSTYRIQDSCANCINVDYPFSADCSVEDRRIHTSGICDAYIKRVKNDV